MQKKSNTKLFCNMAKIIYLIQEKNEYNLISFNSSLINFSMILRISKEEYHNIFNVNKNEMILDLWIKRGHGIYYVKLLTFSN